uniref:Uncharacterized protein n=1 Tax=Anopheles melas TaxID=34690 RepID=A0A182TUI6_9DIPT
MRLTVLICLYLTFLEASVGSLIYPERTLIQMLLGQGRMVTVDELVAAGGSIAQLRSQESSEPSQPRAARLGKRMLAIDGEEQPGEIPAEKVVALKKTIRKLATKKAVKRLVNTRGSVRPKVERVEE